MMENGLLHSVPEFLESEYRDLFESIEDCVLGNGDRFKIFHYILNRLNELVNKYL